MQFLENGRTIKVGVIGLGARGTSWLKYALLDMADVEVAGVCDVYQDRVDSAIELCKEKRGITPVGVTDYHELFAHEEIEAYLVFTSWETHIRVAIDCLNAGHRTGMEVGGACSMEECWELVRTSERTGIPCMLLENCCYGRDEMTILNIARQGLFGEIVHCQGGYQHDLRDEIGNGDIIRHYRQNNFFGRNGELYPTHELGPIAKLLKINRGNRMVSMVSMSSKAVGLTEWLKENRPDSELTTVPVAEGDIVTTLIKCAKGETIVLTHDCTLPRPYSRGGRIQGTKGIWMEDNKSIYIENQTADGSEFKPHKWQSFDAWQEKYEHPLWKAFQESERTGTHGGMDYLVMRAFIESVQNGTEPPIDVYDAAAWLSITVLSEQSIALGSAPVAIPDFTEGQWMHRKGGCTDQYAIQ